MDIFDNAYSASCLDRVRPKRFKLTTFNHVTAIVDTRKNRVYAYGNHCEFAQWTGSHRSEYTDKDAAYVVQMLNELGPTI